MQNSTGKEIFAFWGAGWDPQEPLMKWGENLMHMCLL